MIRIRKLVGENGKVPFDEWFKKLDNTLRARVRARLKRIEMTGNLGFYRVIGSSVCELKFSIGGGLRIYFVKEQGDLILLLAGGNKSSQKDDIKNAIKYWEDYNA